MWTTFLSGWIKPKPSDPFTTDKIHPPLAPPRGPLQSSFLPLPTVKLLEKVCAFILPRAEVARSNIRKLASPGIVVLVTQLNEHIRHFGVAGELFFDSRKVILPRIHPARINPSKAVQCLDSVFRRTRSLVVR